MDFDPKKYVLVGTMAVLIGALTITPTVGYLCHMDLNHAHIHVEYDDALTLDFSSPNVSGTNVSAHTHSQTFNWPK